MSRWFRHYAGMMRDDKLVRAALRSKQPIERVVWIYGVILESAAEIDDGGRYEIDSAELAHFLHADQGDVDAITDALECIGRTAGGFVAKWGARQFQSDRSAERQARYRGRVKGVGDGQKGAGDAEVTAASRHGDAPETETEAKTDKKSGGGDRKREPLISQEAIECAELVATIAGYPDPKVWPKGWCGAPYRVQALISQGWTRADFDAGARTAMKGMAEPPFSFKFFEGPISRAFATRTAPIPVGKPETPHGKPRQRSELTDFIDRVVEATGGVDERGGKGGEDSVRLLSNG